MEVYKTPIAQEQWRALRTGDGIKDRDGQIWKVVRRDQLGDPDRLFAQCPGYEVERLDWNGGQILGEEATIILNLNHPSVAIVK